MDEKEPFPYDEKAKQEWEQAEKQPKKRSRLLSYETNPLDYHTPGPGKDGASITGRVTLGTKHLVGVIVASKETPFDTPGELVRAAVVWYLNEIAPHFRGERIAQGLKELHEYIEDSARDALALNMERTQNVARDRIAKLIRIGAKPDAARAYLKMLRVTARAHPKFGRVMKQWADNEAIFEPIRALADNIEASERPTENSLCRMCEHLKKDHGSIVNDEGESHTFCRGDGVKKRKGLEVAVCGCEGFDWARPETEEELDL